MKLMTKAIEKKLPALRSQDGLGKKAVAHLKLFGGGRFTFYATEYDGDDTFFGYLISPLGEDCDEFCYFSRAELEALRFPPFGLPIERDMYFESRPLDEELAERWGK